MVKEAQLVITLNHIDKHYVLGDTTSQVLKKVSMTVTAGDMMAIVGASGSGKSTLLNILGLLDKPDNGQYLLMGMDVADLSDDKRATFRNQKIGFVFQQFNLLPRFDAAQNVALPLTYRGLSKKDIQEKVDEALARVGMTPYAKHRPMQLSGGQQQRVAIARALVGEPEVLLADEPTGALDSITGGEIMRLFEKLNQEGKTIILVTHDPEVAAQCTRKIKVADGSLVSDTNHGPFSTREFVS